MRSMVRAVFDEICLGVLLLGSFEHRSKYEKLGSLWDSYSYTNDIYFCFDVYFFEYNDHYNQHESVVGYFDLLDRRRPA